MHLPLCSRATAPRGKEAWFLEASLQPQQSTAEEGAYDFWSLAQTREQTVLGSSPSHFAGALCCPFVDAPAILHSFPLEKC